MRCRYWAGVGAGIILGLIFIVAGLGKLLHQVDSELVSTFFTGLLPPSLTAVFFLWLPRFELAIGLLLVFGIAAKFVAVLSSLLIAGFITNNVWLLGQGLGYEPCGCFGLAERIFPGQLSVVGSFYIDAGMLALAFTILFFYQGSFFSIYPWFLRREQNVK